MQVLAESEPTERELVMAYLLRRTELAWRNHDFDEAQATNRFLGCLESMSEEEFTERYEAEPV